MRVEKARQIYRESGTDVTDILGRIAIAAEAGQSYIRVNPNVLSKSQAGRLGDLGYIVMKHFDGHPDQGGVLKGYKIHGWGEE